MSGSSCRSNNYSRTRGCVQSSRPWPQELRAEIISRGNGRTPCGEFPNYVLPAKVAKFSRPLLGSYCTRTQTRNSIPRRVFEHIIVCFSTHVRAHAVVRTSVCTRACVRVLTLYGLRCLTCKLRTSDQEASASHSRLIVVINSCNIINSVTRTPTSVNFFFRGFLFFRSGLSRDRLLKFASHRTGSRTMKPAKDG